MFRGVIFRSVSDPDPDDVPDPPPLPPIEIDLNDAIEQCLADGVIDDPLTLNVNELLQCANKLLGG